MKIPNAFAALSACIVLSSCMGSGVDRLTPPVSISGGEWLVEDIDGRGVIDNARTTLIFGEESRLSGNTACNRYFGSYAIEGSRIQIESVGATKRACPPAVMDQESRFLETLNNVDTYRIDDTGALILSTGSGDGLLARSIIP